MSTTQFLTAHQRALFADRIAAGRTLDDVVAELVAAAVASREECLCAAACGCECACLCAAADCPHNRRLDAAVRAYRNHPARQGQEAGR